jgi:hypothetical protein
MMKKFIFFTFGKLGSNFTLDPHSSKMLDPDPYPDPHIINADPKHWYVPLPVQSSKEIRTFLIYKFTVLLLVKILMRNHFRLSASVCT